MSLRKENPRPASTLTLTLVVAATALLVYPADISAQPFGVRLTLPDDPTTTIAVSWNANGPGDDGIRYGTTSGQLDIIASADETFSQDGDLDYAFTAVLRGLTPATTYYYRVGGAAGTYYPAIGDDPFSFTTLPADPCAPVRFVVVGDNRAALDLNDQGVSILWSSILDETLTHDPDFFVNTGDMVKNGENANEWAEFILASESGFAFVPTLVTMGNHDEDDINGADAIYNQLFEVPRNDRTNSEDYYSIDIGSVHFVSLSTQFTGPESQELLEQVAWLGEDLAANTLPWIVIFFHKAIYTRGNHSTGEENNGTINASFIPLFDEYDVDLVLNGHSHNYERYAPSIGLDFEFGGLGRSLPAGTGGSLFGRSDAIPHGDVGTTYVVTGGAGAPTTHLLGYTCEDAACTYCIPQIGSLPPININCPGEVFENDLEASVIYEGYHNYVVVEITGSDFELTAYATETGNDGDVAGVIDSFRFHDESIQSTLCAPVGADDGGTEGDVGPADTGTADSDMGGEADLGEADTGPAAQDSGMAEADAAATEDMGDVQLSDLGPVTDAGSPVGGSTTEPEDGCGCAAISAENQAVGGFALLLMGLCLVAVRRRNS